MIFKQGFAATLALLMLVSAGFAQAAQDPRDLVQETVERMTSRIDAERERLEKDESYAVSWSARSWCRWWISSASPAW